MTLLVPDGASYKQVKVRLGEIDTPESRQPYGNRARQALSDLAFNQQARVVVQDTDRYGPHRGAGLRGRRGRERGTGEAGGRLGVPQVRPGSSPVPTGGAGQGRQAGTVGTAGNRTLPALDWRKNACPMSAAWPAPASPAASAPTAATSGGFTCAGKRYCREMTSCEEAKFYLTRCGVGSLDGNRDGVPCETLCR